MTYQDNHLRLAKFHFWLAATYFAVLFLPFVLLRGPGMLEAAAIILLLLAAHLTLGIGARRESELARKGSVVIGVLMLLAPPILTVIAIFMLPATKWREQDEPVEVDERRMPE